jgi:hypothetical protein
MHIEKGAQLLLKRYFIEQGCEKMHAKKRHFFNVPHVLAYSKNLFYYSTVIISNYTKDIYLKKKKAILIYILVFLSTLSLFTLKRDLIILRIPKIANL